MPARASIQTTDRICASGLTLRARPPFVIVLTRLGQDGCLSESPPTPRASTEVPGTCTECGACCYGNGPRYIAVSGDDHLRLGDAAESSTIFVGNRCYMRMVERRCVALRGSFAERRCSCSLYETRPEACRRLERGSVGCRAVLARQGIERAHEELPTGQS
jgi:Fe-S-cluster containining protein